MEIMIIILVICIISAIQLGMTFDSLLTNSLVHILVSLCGKILLYSRGYCPPLSHVGVNSTMGFNYALWV